MLASFDSITSALNAQPVLWYVVAFIFGSCIASFINVVVWRLPIMLNDEWNQAAAEQLGVKPPKPSGFTLSKPNSHCPHCKHPIRWYHNLPILGWLILRGKCADCQTPISSRYPIVELIGGLLGAITAYYFPAGWQGLLALTVAWTLLTIALIDWDTQLIPDAIALPLLWAGLLININNTFISLTEAVIGAAAGYGVLWACFKGFQLITGKEGMGYGDFKLLAALGAWFGWQALPTIILIASISGASFGIAQRISGHLKAQQAMPFGPWLALGGLIHLWWGQPLSELLLRI